MKKYFILIILFFLVFYAPGVIKSNVFAVGESCNITPAQINTDGTTNSQATLTTQNYGATAPTWYAKLVRVSPSPYNFEERALSRRAPDPDQDHDYWDISFGPFNAGEEGTYRIFFNLDANVGIDHSLADCQFTVQASTFPPPSGVVCPSFNSIEPPETTITSTSNIQLKYNRGAASDIDKYQVEIFDEINVLIKTVPLTDHGSIWQASVGNLPGPEEVYSAQLINISPRHVCYETPISILDTRQDDGGLGSGRNPCEGGVCQTAFGGISTDITKFAEKFLSIAIGIAGGIALILLVFGSIRVLTSSGNQQTLAAGRDTIIAAIAGLLFLIFSVLILRSLGIIVGITFP